MRSDSGNLALFPSAYRASGLLPHVTSLPSKIGATGYSFDFSFVKLRVVDSDGYPIQKHGVTEYDGLYFLGMPWLHSRRSGILFGVGDDAAWIAEHIAARKITAGILTEVWQPLGARE